MSNKRKQDRLHAGSRKKRGLQVERLEQRALLASIAEFGLTTGSSPTYITSGPNGNLWFTEPGTDKIGEITTSGTVSEFALTAGSDPQGITTGPNGNLWFTEYGTNKIGEITTGGTITEFALTAGSHPQEITEGSNDNLWFTESGTNKIGEITTGGTITEFALAAGSDPFGITSGPNGNLWFTEHGANKVGQIVPSGEFAGTVNTYSLSNGAGPEGITTGSDGNLWFAENGGSNIGQVTLGGQVTEYSIPGENGSPQEIVTGPLGDLYFTESTGNNIVQMTTEGQFTDFAVPTSGADPFGITQGPDNHIWFAENTPSQIGRLNLNPTAVNDTYTASESTAANPVSLNVSAANGVLTNDTDPEDDSLSVLFAWTGNRGTNHGTVTLNSDGSFTYTPDNGYIGTDSFVYQATDGDDPSNTVTVTINVDAPPVAVNDTYTTPVSGDLIIANPALGLLVNDSDPNIGHTLTATDATQPSHGTVNVNPNGTFDYYPTPGYHGIDSFTYYDTDSDGVSVSNTATVNIAVDTPPVAATDIYTTDTNTTLNVTNAALGVLANDTAYNGDTLTASVVTQPTHGSITLNANGTFTYVPTAGYTGTDSFTYKDFDGYQYGNTIGDIITVNALPVAVNDNYEVLQNGTLSENAASGVLANDTGTGTLIANDLSQPSHGTVTLNADGSFTYIPTAGFSGADSFTYQDNDGIANSNTATVSIFVDVPPVAVASTYQAIENTTLAMNAVVGVLANDTSFQEQSLTAVGVTNPTHGTLTLNANGSFNYVPTAGFYGTDSFTYKANDGFADSNTVTVTINVDSPPVVINQSYDDVQNTSLNELAGQGLLVGATSAQDRPLTAVDLTQPSHGTVTVNANGSFSYIPTAGYFGNDSFTYTANDGITNGNTATVSIYVDQPPVGVADLYNVVENTSLAKNAAQGVLANDTDTDEQPLTAALVTTTAHGTLNLFQDGSFTYVPNTNYYGNDTFTYQANDGITDSPITTVTIHVDAPPVGVNDSYNAVENVTLNINAATGVLANDTQAQSEALTASLISNASHGTLTLFEDGSFTYVPTAGYYGTDTFTYKPYDGIANGNLTTVSIFVDSPPVAVNDSYTTALEDHSFMVNAANGVLANDTQAQDESLTAVNPTQPLHGSVTLNANGSFCYYPNNGFYGTDSFTYYAYDGHTDSLTPATVTIRVDAPPVAVADNYEVVENGTLSQNAVVGVLANDTQPQDDSLTAVLVSSPTDAGTFSLNPNGSFTYIPTAGFYGTDSFTYKDSDGYQTGNTVTVSILVDQPPVANPDSYNAVENMTLAVNNVNGLLANDTDAQNNPLTAVFLTLPSNGTLDTNPDGAFNYIPNAGFYGTDSFTYQDSDGFTTGNTTTVTIHVDAPPVAVNDSYNGKEGIPLTVNAASGVLANDTQAQSEPLTAVDVTEPAHGTLTLNPDGSFTYVPNAQFYGTDSFTYAANDGYTTGNTATVTLSVAEDFVPTAQNVSQIVGEGGITVNAPGILTGDTDSNGQPLTAVLVSEPAHGTLTFNANGSYVYIPNSSFGTAGTDSFTFRTFDQVLTSSIATVTLTFDGNYYAPTAEPQTYSDNEGSTLSPSAQTGVLTGADDYWGLELTAVDATEPSHGTLILNANGSFSYTPNAGFFGTDSFTYEANNGHVNSTAQTVTIDVSQVNGAPTANNDSYTTNEATPLTTTSVTGVLANDTDPQSDPLTAILVTNPAHGTVALNGDGSFVYTPVAGFFGTDAFTYKDNDGHADSNTATVTLTVNQVFAPPVAVNDSYTVFENTTFGPAGANVLTNDTDPQSLSLTVGDPGSMATAHGILNLGSNGTFNYTPNAGFTGTDTFTYFDTDGHNNSNTATVTLTIINPLSVTGTTASATTGTSFTGNVGSFTDASPTAPVGNFTATILWGDSTSSPGTITQPGGVGTAFEVSGIHTYGSSGNFTATIVIDDNNSNTASASTGFTVAAANPLAPVAVNDSQTVGEGGFTATTSPGGGDVLANDIDNSVNPLTALFVSGPAHGTLTFNSNGTYVYTPNSSFGTAGTDSFTYRAFDGSLLSNVATVTLTFDGTYFQPVALPQTDSVNEGATLTESAPGVLTGASDYWGLPLTAINIEDGPSHGTLNLNADGSFTYTPTAGYSGTDTFEYEADNGHTSSTAQIVTINVAPVVNGAPTAVNQSYTTPEGSPLTTTTQNGLLVGDSDPNDQPLTALLVSSPTHGMLDFHSNGTFTYTPNADFSGTDTFQYEAFDGTSTSNIATVTLNITAVELPPVAVNDSYTTAEGTTLTTSVQNGVLTNDTDNSDNPLTAILVSGTTEGTLNFNANGSFTYVPNPMFYGTDSFTYEASDGTDTSQPATVLLSVTPVYQPPVVVNSTFSTSEATTLNVNGIGVLAGATDPNNLALTASVISNPSHGTLTLNANGSFNYVPSPSFTGTDSFTFEATDGKATSNIATVTLDIAPIDHPPVATADSYTTTEGQSLTVPASSGVLANDTDNGTNPLTAVVVTEPAHGTLVLNANGSFTYTPMSHFSGVDSFMYQATDGQMASNLATVTLTVNPTQVAPKPAPVAGDYFGTGVADVAVYLVNQGAFAIQPPTGGPAEIVPFGIAGAGQTIPAPGDYFGTGVTDIAAYIPSQGVYAIRNSANGADEIVSFGIAGAGQTIPAPGDYFGTGKDDIAVYLPSIGAFAIRNPAGGPDEIIPFGMAGLGNSIPAPGDYDGSGKTELAVYMPSLGEFAYRPANGGPDVITPFGMAGTGNSIPMPGDYDGSGKTEFAVYMPSTATFAYRPANGGPDVLEWFGIAGAGQTLPEPGDFTGVGHDELAAFLPSTATFAIRPGGGQPDILGSFGAAGLGQTIPVTVVNQALAEMAPSTVTALSIDTPDPSTITDSVIFPTDSAAEKKKKHPGA